jgi:hypothetical protein
LLHNYNYRTSAGFPSPVSLENGLNPVPFGADPKHRPHDGAGHGFFNRGGDCSKTLAEDDGFLVDLGWIRERDRNWRFRPLLPRVRWLAIRIS